MMNLKTFIELDFVQPLKDNKRWTAVNKNKMPIDMNALVQNGRIIGASYKNNNQPYVDLPTLYQILPETTNATYVLKQTLDDIVVLDIEPICPKDLTDRLLTLPYLYAETSMSGKGYHLVFSKPKTKYPDILMSKTALKEKGGCYEILLSHNVTFTGNQIFRKPGEPVADITEFYQLFDELASKAVLTKLVECNTDDLPDIDNIPEQEAIVKLLKQAKYHKKPQDFLKEDGSVDDSRYEFGIAGFYYNKLKQLLAISKYKSHDYTMQERIVLLHEIIKDKVEYREKHDTFRDGLPWLLFTCKRVVTTVKVK